MSKRIGKDEIYVDMLNTTNKEITVQKWSPIAKLSIDERKYLEPVFAGDSIKSKGLYTKEDIEYQIVISQPNDGLIFPGDEKLILNKLDIFL